MRTVEELIQYGIVNIDKPKGPTSHQVSDFVQRILNINKAGHSGTLDPAVTGVLPIALDKATRIVQTLLISGKEYIALMHLHDEVDENKLRKGFKKMTGTIKQLPPIKSAVKRQYRYRKIYEIEILEIDGKDVLFRIYCEAGTYIRKYIHDLGQLLGTGAHMQQLRRIKAGPFDESTLVTLQELSDAVYYWKNGDEKPIRKAIMPFEKAVDHIKKVYISDSCVEPISHGHNLNVPGFVETDEGIEPDQLVAVMNNNKLIALGKAKLTSKKMKEQEKGEAVQINKVFK